MQILADAVTGSTVVVPTREALVHDRGVRSYAGRPGRHAKNVGVEFVHTPELVGRVHVRLLVRHTVGCELARDLPLADARMRPVGPDPAAVQVAGIGADANAAEMRVVTDVDREPAPHLRAAPAARAPRLVTIAARLDERRTLALRFDPAAPAACLFEVTLADGCRGRRARALVLAALPVDADGGRQRVERAVE